MEYETHAHPFAPVCDENCRILILGTFPSVKSRETAFYYGHPLNRFWKVLAGIFESDIPQTIAEKKAFLLQHHIALWDVIESCDIVGSGDSSIKNAVPNNLREIFEKADIQHVFLNGQTAGKLYQKYQKTEGIPFATLPSTSPANAAWSLEKLTDAWKTAILPNMQDKCGGKDTK